MKSRTIESFSGKDNKWQTVLFVENDEGKMGIEADRQADAKSGGMKLVYVLKIEMNMPVSKPVKIFMKYNHGTVSLM